MHGRVAKLALVRNSRPWHCMGVARRWAMDWDRLQKELDKAGKVEVKPMPETTPKPRRLPRKAAQAKWEKPQG